jgi:PAS domain S-box-containing protein
MTKRSSSSYSLSELRKRAEAFLAKSHSEGNELSLRDIQDLVEELRTYQVELEMKDKELRRAYEELGKANEIYTDLYDFAPVAYFTLDENNLIFRVNLAGSELLGLERRQLLRQPFSRFISPDCVDHFYHYRRQCVDTGKRETCELKLIGDAGNQRYIHLESQAVPDNEGQLKRIRMAIIDITARKVAEERIRTLSQELLRSHEDERQMISRELHDRIAQELSAAKMACDTFLDGYPETPAEIKQKASRLSGILQGAIMAVRDLSYELRPPDLEKGKLIQTLTNFCREFSNNTGVKTDFFSAGMEPIELNDLAVINIYRLIQEGLNNIQKHAGASHVHVTVSYSHPDILIRIIDNGKGFDVESRLSTITSEKRMGLRSMEERTKLLGGAMTLQSIPMQGTKVHIRVPYGE